MFKNVLHLEQGCVNPWSQVARKIRFCMVELNLCGQAVRNLLHFTTLAPCILVSHLCFWNMLDSWLKVLLLTLHNW